MRFGRLPLTPVPLVAKSFPVGRLGVFESARTESSTRFTTPGLSSSSLLSATEKTSTGKDKTPRDACLTPTPPFCGARVLVLEWHKWLVNRDELDRKLAALGLDLAGVLEDHETTGLAWCRRK